MSLRIFHLKFPRMKHEENSFRGAREAKRRGFSAIDWDLQLTSDRVIVVTHWDRPMRRDRFYDPRKRISPNTTVAHLTWAQVRRLKTHDGYRIRRLEQMLPVAARLGLTVVLEPKTPAFAADWVWEYITQVADDCGCHIEAYALRSHGGEQTMATARRFGVHPARVIDR